jgi:excisionase family DNA binding protein
MERSVPARHQSPEQDPFHGRVGLGINEAAEALGVTRDLIHKLINAGRLTASKLGTRTIIHAASARRLMQETIVAPKSRPSEVAAVAAQSTTASRANRADAGDGAPVRKRKGRTES